jgi:hypothetical protein
MKEFSLPNVSVASSGDEYFQVHFSDKQTAMTLISSSNGNSNLLAVAASILKAMNNCYAGTTKSEMPSFAEICFALRLFVSHPKRCRYDFRPAHADMTNSRPR